MLMIPFELVMEVLQMRYHHKSLRGAYKGGRTDLIVKAIQDEELIERIAKEIFEGGYALEEHKLAQAEEEIRQIREKRYKRLKAIAASIN